MLLRSLNTCYVGCQIPTRTIDQINGHTAILSLDVLIRHRLFDERQVKYDSSPYPFITGVTSAADLVTRIGIWLSLVERCTWAAEVVGSIPAIPIEYLLIILYCLYIFKNTAIKGYDISDGGHHLGSSIGRAIE